jgi:hypothetical protein
MRAAAVSSLLFLSACAAAPESAAPPAPRAAAQPWGRDPFTRTSQIEIDGNRVGYLVEYLPIPPAVTVERSLPLGSYRIQAADFEDVGFITPRGEVRRFIEGGSTSLGTWSLEEGLLTFFAGERRVRLAPLEPTPPKPRAAAPEKAAGGGGAEGEESGSGESGEPAGEEDGGS